MKHYDVSEEINTTNLEKKIEEKIKQVKSSEKKPATFVKPAIKKKLTNGCTKK